MTKVYGVLYRVRHQLTTEALLSINHTLGYPHMTYCIIIWSCTWPSFLNKLGIAQNKIIRSRLFKNKYDSTYHMYPSLNILNFISFRTYFIILFIYRNINLYSESTIFKFMVTTHNTRRNNINLLCPQFRTTSFNNSVLCDGPKLWNYLTADIKILINNNIS